MLTVSKSNEGVVFHLGVPKKGYPAEIVSDVWKMLNLIHSNIRRDTPEAADIFRMMISGITYEASPLWHEDEPVGGSEGSMNCKVVCFENAHNASFTVGKVYEIKDGRITDDKEIQTELSSLYDLRRKLGVGIVVMKE